MKFEWTNVEMNKNLVSNIKTHAIITNQALIMWNFDRIYNIFRQIIKSLVQLFILLMMVIEINTHLAAGNS
jgi:hypothetical protein